MVSVTINVGGKTYQDELDGRQAPLDKFIRALQSALIKSMRRKFIAITEPKLKLVAQKMASAGRIEFALIEPYVSQHLMNVPNTPGHTTTLKFPTTKKKDDIYRHIVPSDNPLELRNIKSTGDAIIWRALKKKYWEKKGRKGFFDNKGKLRAALATALLSVPRVAGDLKVTYDPAKLANIDLTPDGNLPDKRILLGFFKIKYIKSQFMNMIPALRPFGRLADVDRRYTLERSLFTPGIVTKLGADLQGKGGAPKQRPLVQPVLGWFLLDRIPAAMSRVAAEVLR